MQEQTPNRGPTGGAKPPALRRLRPSGGYRQLRSYQVASVIYDATVSCCDRFVGTRSRTHDQMVQAARSGGKNIAEGSRAGATSSQTELRLVNVARASLEELLLDHEDYLRQHGHRQWTKDDPEALAVRAVGRQNCTGDAPAADWSDPAAHAKVYARWLQHPDPAVVASTLLCLLHQTNYLLDQQISALERSFVEGGGYREQLATARMAERRREEGAERAGQPAKAPNCPNCGRPMARRTARQGVQAGSQFRGCGAYPKRKGIRSL